MLSVFLAFVRTIVFLAGMFFGYMSAALVLSFAGSTVTDFAGVFGGVGLMLAAPLCWIAAVRTKKGDLWTLSYIGGWAIFIATVMLIGVAEGGRPVPRANDSAGLWALGILALIYLVVLPLIAFRHHRRKASSQLGTGTASNA